MTGEHFSDWFKSSVGVRQGCILSPTLFNLFLERIMTEATEDLNAEAGISCGGVRVTNLRFADGIDLVGKSQRELQELTSRLHETSKRFVMEISKDKSKIMASGKGEENINLDIVIDGKALEEVRTFKYLGSTITENGTSDQEIKNRIGIATSAMTKLDTVWRLRGISLNNRIKITKAIEWATLLYGCESWTLSQKYVDKLKAFEMRCYRRILKITWKDNKTDYRVQWTIITAAQPYNNISKRCNLCTSEKLYIINGHNNNPLMNKRSELISNSDTRTNII